MNLKNSLYKVSPSPFDQELELPTSKSHSNRALIIGAMRGSGFRVEQLSQSSDVLTLLCCLKAVGVHFTKSDSSVTFLNSFPSCESETEGEIIDLKTGDGGTTNRFLMALLSKGRKKYRFFPAEKMPERPIDELLLPLRSLGVQIDVNPNGGAWIELQGPAKVTDSMSVVVDCKHSTQFASALMLAFSDNHLNFVLKNIEASETYLKMTESVLEKTLEQNCYFIPVDFSCLSYPLCLALLMGKVLVKNCFELDSFQADSALVEMAQKWGGDIQWTSKGLLVSSINTLKPFEVNGSQFPDLVPALAFLASHIEGESVLSRLSILHFKESDRVDQLLRLLKLFSVDHRYIPERDEIRIQGKVVKYSETNVSLARDHRIVMTAYLFLRKNSGGLLAEIDCIEKSFPHFLEKMA